jgi:hypothetical protein
MFWVVTPSSLIRGSQCTHPLNYGMLYPSSEHSLFHFLLNQEKFDIRIEEIVNIEYYTELIFPYSQSVGNVGLDCDAVGKRMLAQRLIK